MPLISGFSNGGQLPVFPKDANTWGNAYFTSGALTGPKYDEKGRPVPQSSKIQTWGEYFGKPNRVMRNDPMDDQDQENLDLHNAYEGKNLYMGKVMINVITEDDTYPTRDIFPWEKSDSDTIEWSAIKFNDHSLTRTPEESTSEIVSSHVSRGSASVVRYGLGFYMESGFLGTPMGDMYYQKSIQQLANATVETACHGSVFTLMETPPPVDENAKYRDDTTRNQVALDKIFMEEFRTWGALHKNGFGIDYVIQRSREKIQQRKRKAGNYFLWPAGTRKYMNQRPEQKYFFLSGQPMRLDPSNSLEVPFKRPDEVHREGRGFKVGRHGADIDPMFKVQTIGSHFITGHHLFPEVEPEEYKTSMLDTDVLDLDRDDWRRLCMKDTARYYGMYHDWDSEVPSISIHGQTVFGDCVTWGSYAEKVGRIDYIVKNIVHQCKNTQFKQNLMNVIYKAINAPSDKGGDLLARLPFHLRSALVNGRHSEEEIKESVDEVHRQRGIGARSSEISETSSVSLESIIQVANVPDGDKEIFSQLLTSIKQVQTQSNLDLLSVLLTELQDKKPSNPVTYTLHCMSRYLVLADLRIALKRLESEKQPLTALEEKLINMKMKVNDYSGSELSALSAAEADSPHWLPLGPGQGKPSVSLMVNPLHGLQLPVDFASEALTLSSSNRVIFALTSAELAHLKQVRGKIELDIENEHLRRSRIYNADKRMGMLQYMVSLSAVFTLIQKFAVAMDSESKHNGDAYAQLVKDLSEVVSTRHPVTNQEDSHMKRAAMAAAALPIASSQMLLTPMISASQTVLHSIYQNVVQSKPEQLRQQISTAIRSFDSLVLKNYASHSGTGAGLSVFSKQLADLTSNSTGSIKLISREDAMKIVKALHLKLAKENNRSTVADVFTTYSEPLIELCMLWSAKNYDINRYKVIVEALYTLDTEPVPVPPSSSPTWSRSQMFGGIFISLNAIMNNHPAADKTVFDEIIIKPTHLEAKSAREALIELCDLNQMLWNIQANNELLQLLISDFAKIDFVSNSEIEESARSAHTVPVWESGSNVRYDNSTDDDGNPVYYSDLTAYTSIRDLLNVVPVHNGIFFKWSLLNDVPLPIYPYYARPHERFEMGSMAHLCAYGECGKTYWRNPDFQFAKNVDIKTVRGHFTLYQASVVHDPDGIVIVPNVMCREYLGGGGTAIWDPLDEDDVSDYRSNTLTKDIFAIPLPYNFQFPSFHTDITGRYYSSLAVEDRVDQSIYHPICASLNKVWGWANQRKPATDPHYTVVQTAMHNTLTSQGAQLVYNHHAKGLKRFIANRGHWGRDLCPGIGQVFSGVIPYMPPCKNGEVSTTAIGFV